MKILIADDHAVVRTGLIQIISEIPEVSILDEAEDGEQVIILVNQNKYDLVILDISMPKRSGLEVLAHLRKVFPKLPILILSVYPENQYAKRVIQAGLGGFLQNIIIVDDSDILRDRLKTLIYPNKNIKIIGEASNSIEAMRLLSKLHTDIILLDIHMPGANGFKVLSQIRNLDKDVKIIIITNYPTVQYKTAAFELGANYFIDKSEEFETIPDILNEIVLAK
ncbi:unnamed protein product, partial [Cyprideis torosa]